MLAISGGRDSMALLHAAARVLPRSGAVVATFDHATGAAATRATRHVANEAARLGFPVVIGHALTRGTSEAHWRAERHAFLHDVSAEFGADVMTAHTRDDQIETVLMRVLRGSGARGLAGLYARGSFLRPLLDQSRDEVAEYARAVGATWIEDPSNASTAFLRNRVRRDILPALTRVDPALDEALLGAARDAASWRDRVDELARRIARPAEHGRSVSVAAADVTTYSRQTLAVLWPAIAATVGLAMDRRGTERAAAFTRDSPAGGRMPLSGGWQIDRTRDRFELRRADDPAGEGARSLKPGICWRRWCFASTIGPVDASDQWVALLPDDRLLSVRAWRPGDRMRPAGGTARRVKRFLSDARVSGNSRAEWPVVLAGDEIVWIPGVRRSDAAAVRPGRPGVLYRCELHDR